MFLSNWVFLIPLLPASLIQSNSLSSLVSSYILVLRLYRLNIRHCFQHQQILDRYGGFIFVQKSSNFLGYFYWIGPTTSYLYCIHILENPFCRLCQLIKLKLQVIFSSIVLNFSHFDLFLPSLSK